MTSQALAKIQYKPLEIGTAQLGAILVKSGFFQDTRDEAQAIVKILAGSELGFGPIASMQGVYLVKGRVTLSANLVGAAIQRSGKYRYRVTHIDNASCSITFYDGGNEIGESTFSMDDAKKAGLAGGNYDKFSRNMLFSRALTNGARWYCPEVFNGPIYTPDELGASVDDEGQVTEIIEAAPAVVPMREQDVEDAPRSKVPRAVSDWRDRYGKLVAMATEAGIDLDPDHWALAQDATADDIKTKGTALRALIDTRAAEAQQPQQASAF